MFIPRRDTSSRLNSLVGGRLFPGRHHQSSFKVVEAAGEYAVRVEDRQGNVLVSVEAELAESIPQGSVFSSVADASEFFEAGSLGYSPAEHPGKLDALELRTETWSVSPLAVRHVRSTFFEDRDRFREGSVQFDSALLMRNIRHEWHSHRPLYCGELRHAV